MTIGRPSGDWVVDLDLTPDVTVSRQHARLTYDNGYWLEDLNSRGGTWVNEQRITIKTRVSPEDQIRMGQTNLVLQPPPPSFQAEEETEDTQPIRIDEEDNPLKSGFLDNSVSAAESPSKLLLAEKPDQQASLEVIQGRLSAFYELGAALGTVGAVEPLLKTVVEHLRKAILGAQRGAILLKEGRKLLLKAYVPEKEKIDLSISLHLARLAIEKQEAFIWRFGAPGEMGQLTDSILWHGTKCAMYAPLIWQDEVLGIVYVDNFVANDAFNNDDLHLLMAMASQAAMFVKNHALQKDLLHQQVVRSNLLRQFSPQVAEHLENMLKKRGHLGLGGERVEPVTVLNSDVRGFTALSAKMDPSDVMEMLNQLFGACIPIIFKYNGTVDKYIGDAILAVFGSPNPDPEGSQWEDAVRAALEMQHAVRKLSKHWQSLGRPVFQIGIGIHTGAVLQGFIGSQEQMEYTVIGDTVNRVTRYCYGAGRGEVIISTEVYRHVSNMIEVVPKTVRSKHPDTESDLEAYVVRGFSTQKFRLAPS